MAFADDFQGGVGGDAQEPGGETGFLPEILEILEGAEEGLLGDIFGIVVVGGDAAGEGVNAAFVSGDELFEGGEVAGLGLAHKFRVRRL